MLRFRILFFIFFFGLSIQAQTAPITKSKTTQIINGETFIIHTVHKGETLYGISRAYNVSVDDLKKNNSLDNGLQLNQKIKIPYPKKAAAKTHYVKAGETLYSIARAYSVDVNALKAKNPSAANGLKIGQKLIIPSTGKTAVSHKPAINQQYPKNTSSGFKTHIVKPGETLYSISRLYKISPTILLKHNPEIASGLKIGQKLKIPVEKKTDEEDEIVYKKSTTKVTINGRNFYLHKAQKGETVYSIAKLYGLQPDVLYKENPRLKDGLQPDQKLKIPAENSISVSNYVFHTVNKGETLYSISKQYSVSTADILNNNPVVQKEGLKTKMVIKIPANATNIELAKQNQKNSIIYHVVAEGETLYSISGKYQCPVKEIKKLNPAVDVNALKVGTVIKVRVDQQRYWQYTVQAGQYEQSDSLATIDSLIQELNCDSILEDKSTAVKVALFAPFFTTANDTMDLSDKISKRNERIYKKSIMYVHFYQGVLMALDELKKQGYTVVLNVYDTENDTTKVKNIVKGISKENTDIIIGPFLNNMFKIVSEKANSEEIFIISPLSPHPGIINNQPYTILANTPQKYRTESSALFVSQYIDFNYILIHNNGIKERDMIRSFKDILFSSHEDSTYFSSLVLKEINFKKDGIKAIEDAVSIISKNVIYIPSDDPAFVNDILTRLYRFVDKYEVEVHGLAQWERFKNLELEYLYKLNFHFTTSNYRNYKNEDAKSFISSYRNIFSTEPSKFVFQGRDITMFATKLIAKYRTKTCNCIENFKFEGIHTTINVDRYGENQGYANSSIFLIEYTPQYSRDLIEFDAQLAKQMLKDIKLEDTEMKFLQQNEDDNWDY